MSSKVHTGTVRCQFGKYGLYKVWSTLDISFHEYDIFFDRKGKTEHVYINIRECISTAGLSFLRQEDESILDILKLKLLPCRSFLEIKFDNCARYKEILLFSIHCNITVILFTKLCGTEKQRTFLIGSYISTFASNSFMAVQCLCLPIRLFCESERETRWEEQWLTAETTFSTQQHPGQHVNLQQLKLTLPLKDWTVQPRQVF